MRESKDHLLEEKLKENNNSFISKKIINSNSQNQKENPVKFTIKKALLFKIELSSKSSNKRDTSEGRWSKEEHDLFLKGLGIYGPKWKKFKNLIKSRTLTQVRSHAQKFYLKMKSCKNENLGINFTLNSIRNINDMINQIKNINKNNDIVNIFELLDNEYNNYEKNKKINIKKNVRNVNEHEDEIKFNTIKENDKNENNFNVDKNFLLNIMKEKFIFGNSIDENDLLSSNKELSLDEEENIPKQYFKDLINHM